MGLRGLITLDINSDVKTCLNIQVSSTSILVMSTVVPNIPNSGLKGKFQIASSTPLVYVEKGATKWNMSHFVSKESVKKICSLFFFFYEKVKKIGQQLEQIFHLLLASVISLCVLPFSWPLSFISFGPYVPFSPSVSLFFLSFSCPLSFQSKSPDI